MIRPGHTIPGRMFNYHITLTADCSNLISFEFIIQSLSAKEGPLGAELAENTRIYVKF